MMSMLSHAMLLILGVFAGIFAYDRYHESTLPVYALIPEDCVHGALQYEDLSINGGVGNGGMTRNRLWKCKE